MNQSSSQTEYTLEDQGNWWRKQIRAGLRTESDLVEWVEKRGIEWSQDERLRFQTAYEGGRLKWDKWRKPLSLGK